MPKKATQQSSVLVTLETAEQERLAFQQKRISILEDAKGTYESLLADVNNLDTSMKAWSATYQACCTELIASRPIAKLMPNYAEFEELTKNLGLTLAQVSVELETAKKVLAEHPKVQCWLEIRDQEAKIKAENEKKAQEELRERIQTAFDELEAKNREALEAVEAGDWAEYSPEAEQAARKRAFRLAHVGLIEGQKPSAKQVHACLVETAIPELLTKLGFQPSVNVGDKILYSEIFTNERDGLALRWDPPREVMFKDDYAPKEQSRGKKRRK